MLVYSAMAVNSTPPDYDLADRIALTEPAQVKAISHPLRNTILGLLHERAATVSELAVALERPKSTVAHHVKVLNEAGLVQVVRTRRVRAIEERFYGRTARMFYVSVERSPDGDECLGTSTTSRSPPGSRPGVPGREVVGLHPARPHLGGAGVGVLGADGGAGGGVRPAPAVGRHDVRIRGRRLSHRPSDPTGQRRLGLRFRSATSPNLELGSTGPLVPDDHAQHGHVPPSHLAPREIRSIDLAYGPGVAQLVERSTVH